MLAAELSALKADAFDLDLLGLTLPNSIGCSRQTLSQAMRPTRRPSRLQSRSVELEISGFAANIECFVATPLFCPMLRRFWRRTRRYGVYGPALQRELRQRGKG